MSADARSARRLLVFARAPVPGEAKTRLIPALGAEGAAALHARLVRRTLGAVRGVAPVTVCCAPGPDHPFFQSLAVDLGVALQAQAGADLGERMSWALREALRGARAVVLIGTDCADLQPTDLADAFGALEQVADAALGPVADGGYWLIGLRRWDGSLFAGMPWSTDAVLDRTRGALSRLGWRWRELPVRHDLDRPEDLVYLKGLV
ncbi:MAG: TIGR04282 family arsenosugar biosynthesis glycosyltransferase [Gammaproteobacteria bacterium]|jgi:hypothetical protein|nr:TIGR04282 family arsenosugar biosynthesis glycosyltransferase [Gammaproteobacteria bacterium]